MTRGMGALTVPLPDWCTQLPDAVALHAILVGAKKNRTLYAFGLVVRRAIYHLTAMEAGHTNHPCGWVHSNTWFPNGRTMDLAEHALNEMKARPSFADYSQLQELTPLQAVGAISYTLYALNVLDAETGIINVSFLNDLHTAVLAATSAQSQNNSNQQSGNNGGGAGSGGNGGV